MRTVIITGGNSGIGLEIAKKFHQNNYFVIVGGRKDYGLEKIFSENFSKNLNKVINKQNGIDIIASYKRASNILESELKKDKIELSNTTDPGIFKTELEKNLFKKINELRKYFSSINNDENFVQTLDNLANIKREVFDFFDNVIVNEDDLVIKKNRLELIQMMCKTFDNYVNFSLIESS